MWCRYNKRKFMSSRKWITLELFNCKYLTVAFVDISYISYKCEHKTYHWLQILFILYHSKVAPFFYQTIVVNRPNHSEIGNIAKVIIHISFALSPCLIYLSSKNIILRESYKTFSAPWRPSIFICVNGFEYLMHDYSLDLLWRLMIPLFWNRIYCKC